MKKLAFAMFFYAVIAFCPKATAQCTFISPTVDINTTTVSGANCVVDFNLSFDIITNSGNKIIYLHLWRDTAYPSHDYSCNQCQPTYSVPDHNGKKDLSNSIIDIAINNFGATPVFLTSYGPDPTTPIQSPSNNPSMTIVKTASSTAGANRFIISHVIATVPGACNNSIVFKGDAWSSNSNSSNAAVQCAMQGFSVGLTDPLVSGFCANSVPGQYRFTISTPSPSRQVYYDVYLDNGNNIFDPVNDSLIRTVPITSAITITPSTPFNSGNLNYPNQSYSVTRKLYVVVATVGESYLISTEITPCSGIVLGITLKNFYAQRKDKHTVALSWQTASEKDMKEFVVERGEGDGFISAGIVPATNKSSGSSYTFNDFNSSAGSVYYRLKTVDNDGSASYSDIIQVKSAAWAGDFSVYPNPATGTTVITVKDISVPATLQVIDNVGRLIETIAVSSSTVQLSGLEEGLYLVRVINGTTGEGATKTLVVVR
ncbi:T9SS type A sorting domain-containing protein [Chitinophagaceae bacterium MMS25-I14]